MKPSKTKLAAADTTLVATTATLLAQAEAEHLEATRKRDDRAAQAAYAKREFHEEQSALKRETLRASREDLEVAEHALEVAGERLKAAQDAHAKAVRREDMAAYEKLKLEVLALNVRLPEFAKRFIALAAEQHAAVLEVARAVAAAADARAKAEEAAARLGVLGDLDREVPVPEIAEAKLAIRRLTTAARLTANTPDVSGWWADVSDDVRLQGLTAREIRNTEEFVAHTRAEAEAAAARSLREQIAALSAPSPRPARRPLTSPDPGEQVVSEER